MASWKILLTAAGALLAAGASAADSGWLNAIDRAAAPKEAPNVRVELIAQNKALTPQAKNTLAVVFHHEPGWHTYWRMPGEAGLPTSFSFVTPNGFQAHTPSFPLPERFLTSGLVTYGYGGETIFPFQLDVPRRTAFGSRQTVTVNVSFLACKDVCVPGEASASIRLPVAVRPDPGPNAARIQAAERLIPEVVANEHVTATIEENRLRIDVPAQTGKIAESLTFFPLAADAMDIKVEPVLRRHEDGSSELHLRAADVFAGAPRETLERPSGVAGLVQIGAHVEIVRFRQKPQGVDAVATPKPQKRGAVLRPVALPHLGRLLFGETEFLHQKAVHPIVQGDEKAARRTKNRIVEIDEPKLHGGALRRDRHPSFFAAEKYRHTHSFRKKRKNPTEQRILFSCVLLPGFG